MHVGRIDGWDDVAIVLELVEVRIGCCDSIVERVDQRRVIWAEREFIDVVGEVELCD